MKTIRITKEFRFEAAHALKGYDGPCRHVHGHSYLLSVTLTGTPIVEKDHPKLGMVMDFGDLKRLIKKHVVDRLDHALLLHDAVDTAEFSDDSGIFGNILLLPYQPTSENLLLDFAEKIRAILPPDVALFSMRLRETTTSYAEWFASDNIESLLEA